MGNDEKTDKSGQASEKINIRSDELKSKISSMMNLVEDDDADELDEKFVEEISKPKKKKFFGLF